MKVILICLCIYLLSSNTFASQNHETAKVIFEKDSGTLSLENQKLLDSLLPQFLSETQQDYSANIKIEAYSDVDEKNNDLSKQRAETIKNYLISKNILPEKFLIQNINMLELMMREANLALYRDCKVKTPSQNQIPKLKNVIINPENFSPKDVHLNTPVLQYVKRYHALIEGIQYFVPREYTLNIESFDSYVAKVATYFTLKPEQIEMRLGSLSMSQQNDSIQPSQDVQVAQIILNINDNLPQDKIPYLKFQHNSSEISEEKKNELSRFAEAINGYPLNIKISCRNAINEDNGIYLKRAENIKNILSSLISEDKEISIDEEYQENNEAKRSDNYSAYINVVHRYPSLYKNVNDTFFVFEENSAEINAFTRKGIVKIAELLKQNPKVKLKIAMYFKLQEQADIAKKRSENITAEFEKQNIKSDFLKYVFVDLSTQEAPKYSRAHLNLSVENIPVCYDEKIDLPNCIEETQINKASSQ